MAQPTTDGILNINKPRGKTSFEVVHLIRELISEKRVGHGGTLDPAATGVLPICLGQATRVSEFMANASKVYRAEVELGVTTTTYDSEGDIVGEKDTSSITKSQVEECLNLFEGSIEQTPPMFSAIRHEGKHLYELARQGLEVERKPRNVQIFGILLLEASLPVITLEISCSRGTYIRSLANDLGQRLGCGAYLKSLVRLQTGPFHLSEALTLPELISAFRESRWREFLYPMDIVLLATKAALLGKEAIELVRNGVPLKIPGGARMITDVPYPPHLKRFSPDRTPPHYQSYCRAYSSRGQMVALLRYEEKRGVWQPWKVFA